MECGTDLQNCVLNTQGYGYIHSIWFHTSVSHSTMTDAIHKAGHVYSRSVNHAHGRLPCAWFSVWLYTWPAAHGGRVLHTAAMRRTGQLRASHGRTCVAHRQPCASHSRPSASHGRAAVWCIHSPDGNTHKPHYYRWPVKINWPNPNHKS